MANGIHACILPPDSPRYLATPELSFAIRHLRRHGGLNISASHNPPDDNGGKFYDERGGQPVPPDDQIMADLVEQVTTIRSLSWADAVRTRPASTSSTTRRTAATSSCAASRAWCRRRRSTNSRSSSRRCTASARMTAMEVLDGQGFRVMPVAEQMTPDGQFPNVTKTPNPEVPESMDRAAVSAPQRGADLVLATDPDADRLGAMAPDRAGSLALPSPATRSRALLTHFKLDKLAQHGRLPASPIVITTEVTTGMVTRIARHFGCQVVDNLLVGFKYIADVLWQLEQNGCYEDVAARRTTS